MTHVFSGLTRELSVAYGGRCDSRLITPNESTVQRRHQTACVLEVYYRRRSIVISLLIAVATRRECLSYPSILPVRMARVFSDDAFNGAAITWAINGVLCIGDAPA